MATTQDYLKTDFEITNYASNFSSQLNNILQGINSNFQKLMAKPFLKGDEGEGIVYSDETVYDNNGDFTPFGKILIGVLFDIDDTSNITTLSALKTVEKIQSIIDGTPQRQITAVDKWPTDSSLTIKCASVGNKKYIFPPYYFIDSRLNNLKELTDDSKSDFIDYSCYIIGEYDGTNWSLYKKQIMPTLYYDSDIDEFCWLVNGDKTGITAQGVKGDNGKTINIWNCNGHILSNSKIIIDTIISSSTGSTNISDIEINDFIIVYFNKLGDIQSDNDDCTLGIAKSGISENTTYTYITYDPYNTFSYIMSALSLPDLLNTIGTTVNSARGLYFPFDNNNIEIIAKQSNGKIVIGKTSQSNKLGINTNQLNIPSTNTWLELNHNTSIKSISGQTTTETTIEGSTISSFTGNTPDYTQIYQLAIPDKGTEKRIELQNNTITFKSNRDNNADLTNISTVINGNCSLYTSQIELQNSTDYQFLSGKTSYNILMNNNRDRLQNILIWTKIGNIVNVNGKLSINHRDNEESPWTCGLYDINFYSIMSSNTRPLFDLPIILNNSTSTGKLSDNNYIQFANITVKSIDLSRLLAGTANIVFTNQTQSILPSSDTIFRTNNINPLSIDIMVNDVNNPTQFFFNTFFNTSIETYNDCYISHIQYNFSYLLEDKVDIINYSNIVASNIITNPGSGGSSQGGGSAS